LDSYISKNDETNFHVDPGLDKLIMHASFNTPGKPTASKNAICSLLRRREVGLDGMASQLNGRQSEATATLLEIQGFKTKSGMES
jgi:hypothetical protein